MNLRGKTLLVVDDEKDIADILATEVRALGAQAIISHNVAAASKLIESNDISLVVSDIRMPGSTGVELLDRVRAARRDVPVVLITGFADLSLADAYARGAEALLQKPFDLDSLFSLIENLMTPIPQRWARTVLALPEVHVGASDLSYGRGGVFVPSARPPKLGSRHRLVVEAAGEAPSVFEVVCRWSRQGKSAGRDGWGAEIVGWDEATAARGWPHATAAAFIPLT